MRVGKDARAYLDLVYSKWTIKEWVGDIKGRRMCSEMWQVHEFDVEHDVGGKSGFDLIFADTCHIGSENCIELLVHWRGQVQMWERYAWKSMAGVNHEQGRQHSIAPWCTILTDS